MGSFDKTVAASLRFIPRPLVRRVARQYIAGSTLEEAITETRRLNEAGCMVTMDLLGEELQHEEEATEATQIYLSMLDAIEAHGLDANVSIKPTGTGLTFGIDTLLGNLRLILQRAREHGNTARIDMEDSSTTDDTLRAYRILREEGWDNVGVVLQSMLHRTPADVEALRPLGPSIRLCKGIYQEPPEHAIQGHQGVVDAYIELLTDALSRPELYIGIATHDDQLIEAAEGLIAALGLDRERYEFQMLLRVRPRVRARLVEAGHRVRVYVPFGESWYAYCLRRLRENPKFASYVTADVMKNPLSLFGEGGDR